MKLRGQKTLALLLALLMLFSLLPAAAMAEDLVEDNVLEEQEPVEQMVEEGPSELQQTAEDLILVEEEEQEEQEETEQPADNAENADNADNAENADNEAEASRNEEEATETKDESADNAEIAGLSAREEAELGTASSPLLKVGVTYYINDTVRLDGSQTAIQDDRGGYRIVNGETKNLTVPEPVYQNGRWEFDFIYPNENQHEESGLFLGTGTTNGTEEVSGIVCISGDGSINYPYKFALIAGPSQTYSVIVIPGNYMTRISGEEQQSGLGVSAMQTVSYKADDDYYFGNGYDSSDINGITVERYDDDPNPITNSKGKYVKIYGKPTANTVIKLADPTPKTPLATPSAVFTPTGAHSGTLTNIKPSSGVLGAALYYRVGESGDWTKIGSNADSITISGISNGDIIQVYEPASVISAKTHLDSAIQSITVSIPDGPCTVTIVPGEHMTKTVDSGAAEQTVSYAVITDVIYTADDGYYFPTTYSVEAVNGITVKRNSYTKITVSGRPTADAVIALPAPAAKEKLPTPEAVFTPTPPDSGTLTNVTTAMYYRVGESGEWTKITDTSMSLTGLSNGDIIQVYQKIIPRQRNTNYDSDIQSITVTMSGTSTSVTLDKTALALGVNGTETLTATVLPENAGDKTVKWSVGGTDANAVKLYSDANCNTEVGTDATDTLTVYAKGISAGSATITVITTDGGFTKTCTVTVKEPVTGVSLNPGTLDLSTDGVKTLTATISPENATDKTVKWSVGGTDVNAVKLYSDEDCTTVIGADATSTLTVYAKGMAAGEATITVTSNDDATMTATCNVTVTEPVASITRGTTTSYYASLAEAVAAAQDGDTVKLLQDIELTKAIDVDKQVTLDTNGKNITAAASYNQDYLIGVKYGGDLTIMSSDRFKGRIDASNVACAIKMTLKGETYNNTPAKLTVNKTAGAIMGYYYGICGNGTRNGTEIMINGGAITGGDVVGGTRGCGIYHPQIGTLTINRGTINGGETAVEMRAGTLVINDGLFTAIATPAETTSNGSGTTSKGAAIAIAQHTTKQPISVTINDGIFQGYSAFYESNPEKNGDTYISQISLSITGGEFEAVNGGSVAVYSEDAAKNKINGFISGGSFSSIVENEYCAVGYIPKTEKVDGMYNVTEGWKISFNLGEAIGTMQTQTVVKGNSFTVPGLAEGVTPPANKEFDGWTFNGTAYAADESFTPASDVTLTAQWKDAVTPGTGGNGGYIAGSNATIRESLMWRVYFKLNDGLSVDVDDENTYISTSAHPDATELNGHKFKLSSEPMSGETYYMITVPIRPRLINEDVGFTLVINGVTYTLRTSKSATTEYISAPYSFNSYLDTINNPSYSEVIKGLRDFRDVLLQAWPVN